MALKVALLRVSFVWGLFQRDNGTDFRMNNGTDFRMHDVRYVEMRCIEMRCIGGWKVKSWFWKKVLPQRRLFIWVLLPASPWLLCALLLSAVNVVGHSSAPGGGQVCPPAHLSPFSSGSPASVCDGGSSSCIVCWSVPSPPGLPL